MALERKDVVQDNSTTAGTGAFTMAGTPPVGFVPFSVHTTGATFDYKAVAGSQIEVGTGTWNGATIARSPSVNFNGGALVNFSTPPVVMEVVSAASVAAFLRAADGVDVSTLTAVGSLNTGDSVLLLRSGVLYTALASLFGSTSTTTSAQVITVNNPGPQTVGVTYTASGTYTNGTPTALDFSVDGGTNWNAVASPTISGGTFSFPSTPSTASASRQMMVRDHTTLVYGTSSAYVVSAAGAQAITVANPGTQTVGTAFNVTGTYVNGTPTALDYRLSDDTAGVWTQVTTATISGGTFSFSQTPTSASAGRTISVRDRTTQVAGTSGTYVVNAAGAAGDTLTDLRMVTASGSPVVYTGDGTATNFNQAAGGLWSKYFPANTDGSLTFEIPSTSGTMRFCLTDAANNGTLTPFNYAIWNLTNLYGTGINYEQSSPNNSYSATPTTNASIKPANNDVVKLDLINRSGAANTATLVVSVARAATPTTFTEIFRLPNFPNIALYPRWTITGAASIDKLQSTNLVAR